MSKNKVKNPNNNEESYYIVIRSPNNMYKLSTILPPFGINCYSRDYVKWFYMCNLGGIRICLKRK